MGAEEAEDQTQQEPGYSSSHVANNDANEDQLHKRFQATHVELDGEPGTDGLDVRFVVFVVARENARYGLAEMSNRVLYNLEEWAERGGVIGKAICRVL